MAWTTGYFYPNWDLPVASIPFSKYTHLIYAFASPNADGTLSGDMSDLPAFVSGAHSAGAKALIGLGDGDWLAATSSGTRAAFVSHIQSFLSTYNLDGVDLDWEAGINDAQYAALMQALRTALGSSKLITTAAYGGLANSPLASIVLAGHGNLDQVNAMTYDLDLNATKSWYNTAIYPGPNGEWSIKSALDEFIGQGVPAAKIGIGIPFYGHRWNGPSAINQTKGSEVGDWVNYFDLVTSGRLGTTAQKYDSTYGGEYLSYSNEFWPFTGPRQISDIVAYGTSRGVGGYMAFDLNMEYVASASGNARWPLSTALAGSTQGGASSLPAVSSFGVTTVSGQPALTWTTDRADSVSINQGIGPVAPSGSIVVNPTATTTYTITATNTNGSQQQSATIVFLRRSVFGAPQTGLGSLHVSGKRFLFLGPPGPESANGILKIAMDPLWIGRTLHFKITSVNKFGGAVQSTQDVADYTYTPIGIAQNQNPNAVNYTNTPGAALSLINPTTVHMVYTEVQFPGNVVHYVARNFTISALDRTYYVVIEDPGYLGDIGSNPTRTAYIDDNQDRVGKPGYAYMGSIGPAATVGGTAPVVTIGGWPPTQTFLVNGT